MPFEKQTLQIRALVTKKGHKSAEKAHFTFFIDGTQKDDLVPTQVQAGTEAEKTKTEKVSVATILALPAVPDDKESYKLTYKAGFSEKVDEQMSRGEEFIVYPEKIEIEPSTEDTSIKRVKVNVVGLDGSGASKTSFFWADIGKKTLIQPKLLGIVDGPVTIAECSPFKLEWLDGTKDKRKCKCKVTRLPWTADFHFPSGDHVDKDKAVKQYVNLTETPGSNEGNPITITVGAKATGTTPLVTEGDVIYVQATFQAENSKRNDPAQSLTIGSATTLPGSNGICKGEVTLGANGKGTFKLQFSASGGDLCEIKIGKEDTCADATLWIETWRKFDYETWQPKNDGGDDEKLSSWTLGGTAGTAGMSAGATTHLEKTFAGDAGARADREKGSFIEANCTQSKFYTADDLIAQSWIPVSGTTELVPSFKGDFFGESASNKRCILTWGQIWELVHSLSPSAPARLCQILFADFIASEDPLDQTFAVPSAGKTVRPNRKKLLPWRISGTPVQSIESIEWRADVKASGAPDFVRDPDGKGWTALTLPADIDQHVSITKVDALKISLPNVSGKANYPGTYAASKAGAEVKFSIRVKGMAWSWGDINGCAVGGIVAMNDYSADIGSVDPIGVTNVIIHEIGHNMGQAYADKATDATFGRTTQIPNIPFPKNTSATPTRGEVYGGKGHTGTHCAKGLSADHKACAAYGAFAGEATCVMFGADDMTATATKSFCADCRSYLRAEDLRSIRKSWTT